MTSTKNYLNNCSLLSQLLREPIPLQPVVLDFSNLNREQPKTEQTNIAVNNFYTQTPRNESNFNNGYAVQRLETIYENHYPTNGYQATTPNGGCFTQQTTVYNTYQSYYQTQPEIRFAQWPCEGYALQPNTTMNSNFETGYNQYAYSSDQRCRINESVQHSTYSNNVYAASNCAATGKENQCVDSQQQYTVLSNCVSSQTGATDASSVIAAKESEEKSATESAEAAAVAAASFMDYSSFEFAVNYCYIDFSSCLPSAEFDNEYHDCHMKSDTSLIE